MDKMDEMLTRIKAREAAEANGMLGAAGWQGATARYLVESKQRAWERIEVPSVLADVVAAEMAETNALAEAKKPRVLCCLSGPPGTGKTVAACAWLREFCFDDRNHHVAIVSADFSHTRFPPLFVGAARLARWERYDDERMKVLLRAVRLVVDDIGTEYADTKGNFMAVFDELVSERAGNKRPTIITTNLDGKTFKVRYGARIADRIRESGAFVSIAGPSMRGTK